MISDSLVVFFTHTYSSVVSEASCEEANNMIMFFV